MMMTKATKKDNVILTPALADVIKKPLITEKATLGSQNAQVSFLVDPKADKPTIKRAIEALFDVKVKAVNTSNLMGKTKRFKGRLGKRSDTKKAIVTLADGQMIDVGTKIS
jgi:large subunit ribosomal protein L23